LLVIRDPFWNNRAVTTSLAPAPLKWKTRSIGMFYGRDEGTTIYFDPASGDTHLISDFAAFLVRHLVNAAQPLDLEEIIELVRIDIEAEDLPELRPAISGILNDLADLDILVFV
jgi:hypothetical protein